MRKVLTGCLPLISGCCAPGAGGSDDLSWIGGAIGVIIGFGLFFLTIYLSSRR